MTGPTPGGAKILQTKTAVVIAITMLAGAAAPATAGHADPTTSRATYEVGLVGDRSVASFEDPAGATADGRLQWGGALFLFPEHRTCQPCRPLSLGDPVVVPGGDHAAADLAVVDDAFGTDVGIHACQDIDADGSCGGPHEPEVDACGPPFAPITSSTDHDGDGHDDLGMVIVVWVNGPVSQAIECGSTSNPVGGTTGGVVSAAGGIYLTAS